MTIRSVPLLGGFIDMDDLWFTADAFEAMQGPLLAIDMIRARRSNGVLKVVNTRGGHGVSQMPEELWQQVKEDLMKTEMEAAELDLVELFTEIACYLDGHDMESDPQALVRLHDVVSSCSDYLIGLYEYDGVYGMLKLRKKVVGEMFRCVGLPVPADFNLQDPFREPNTPATIAHSADTISNDLPSDDFALTLSYPNYPDDYDYKLPCFYSWGTLKATPPELLPGEYLAGEYEYEFSPQIFTLPRNAAERFNTAFQFLRLESPPGTPDSW
ncbi:hypothetical protein JCM1840_003050 [Sporobolomyces johnsonii]